MGREKMTVEARATNYTGPDAKLPIAPLTKQPVSLDKVKGTIYFDRTIGKLSESEMSMSVKGAFRVPGNKGQKEALLEMTQDRTIKIKLVKK
jgi:hypothetical protein